MKRKQYDTPARPQRNLSRSDEWREIESWFGAGWREVETLWRILLRRARLSPDRGCS